jgi:hypothetical protein
MARSKAPLDLRPPSADRWAALRVPKRWEPIAKICRRVSDEADRVTERIVGCIEEEIPAYQNRKGVPRPDLDDSVRRNIEMMFFGLAENRGPAASELKIRRELGHRRAMQGLPVDALLQAYHVGYRELWLELVAQAGREGRDAERLLLTAATTFWGWIHSVTEAVAEAYDETSHARERLASGMRQRFVELLVTGDIDSEEIGELARSLGFVTDGVFRAMCIRPGVFEGGEPARLQLELAGVHGVNQCLARGHEILIVSQEADVAEVEKTIRRALPSAAIGMGLARQGLAGARQTVIDGERALSVAARRRGTIRFEDDWFFALVLRSHDDLLAILGQGAAVARNHEQIAETVRCFATSGFSVSETARRMFIHPNSVTYRLDRWHQLTGWDPRDFSGILNSLAALEIVN